METASEWAKNFEQRWDEYVLEKTTDELRSERESLLDDFRDYAEIGQGISTKETIRLNRIEKELRRRGIRVEW
jgi:hypothetical protein